MRVFVFLSIIALLLFSACQKTGINNNPSATQISGGNAGNGNSGSAISRLSYGDTIFYNHTLLTDKFADRVSTPPGSVKYRAIPGGLIIDSVTGRINITKSESGLRYKVYAFDAGGLALDSVKIVISGIDYADGIFDISTTPNTYDTSFPIYNARPELLLPCSDDDDDDDDACVFDETDLDDDGNDDIAGVIQDKLLVDIKTGTIDLEASYKAGIFGSSPANGTVKDFLMYYRLNDASGRSLQKINIRVYYYKRRSDIPQTLLNELAARAGRQTAVNARTSVTSLEYSEYKKPKRPPLLIIVGGTQ
jgi:hypothetical protein